MDLPTFFKILCIIIIVSSYIYDFTKSRKTKLLQSGNLKPCQLNGITVKEYEHAHELECIALYEELEKNNQIPSNDKDKFVDYLKNQKDTKWVFIHEGNVIATCGINQIDEVILFLYGLVKPSYQKKGIGNFMLCLRVMEVYKLKKLDCYAIILNATKKSYKYYKKLGFSPIDKKNKLRLKDHKKGINDFQNGIYKSYQLISWVTKNELHDIHKVLVHNLKNKTNKQTLN